MNRKRELERYPAVAYFAIYDLKTKQLLGCLVDINTNGLKVTGKKPFQLGFTYKLSLEMHEEIRGSKYLSLAAKNVWCKKSEESDLYQAGFQFSNIDERTKERIDLLTQSSEFIRIIAMQPQK